MGAGSPVQARPTVASESNQQGAGTEIFLPLVMRQGIEPESGLEITQAVQQPGNPVFLIDGRTTYVRYSVTSPSGDENVSAYLSGSRDGTPLPGSPLPALNNPKALQASVDRTVLSDTYNFLLPASWTTGSVQLQGTATNGTTFSTFGAPETVTFLANAPLAVTVIPIAYTCTSGGSGTVTPSGPFSYLDEWPLRLYPVPEVDQYSHGAVAYSGPCSSGLPTPVYSTTGSNDWTNMLDLIRSVWISDGSPNRYYYGLVSIDCGGSCIAGIGWVGGWKAAVGWNGWGSTHNGASETTAHEIGHNHGLQHAPGCGAGNPDPAYPYSGALIGDGANPNFGFDITSPSIKPYGSTYDFMSYCSNVWISDYNYGKLYMWEQAQPSMTTSADLIPQDALLISGFVDGEGNAHLQPAYRLDLPLSRQTKGDYALQLLGEQGNLLADYSFQPIDASEDALGAAQPRPYRGFQLAVPYLPGVEGVRIMHAGQEIGSLKAKGPASALRVTASGAQVEQGQLRASWIGPEGTSYMVRLSTDGGVTWRIVGKDLSSPNLDLPLAKVSGQNVELEILASDGLHTKRLHLGSDSSAN